MENENKDDNRLHELGGSDYEMVEGQPDIRGWKVKTREGNAIGEVDELIFDTESRKVRYIVLDLEGNTFDINARDVLVPIGLAELHESDDDVILPNITAGHLSGLPEYDKNNITRDTENRILKSFAVMGFVGEDAKTENFYDNNNFNQENLYRKRLPESSGIIQGESEDDTLSSQPESVGVIETETSGIFHNFEQVENDVYDDDGNFVESKPTDEEMRRSES